VSVASTYLARFVYRFRLASLAATAFLAISERLAGDNFLARALPPIRAKSAIVSGFLRILRRTSCQQDTPLSIKIKNHARIMPVT